MQQIEVFPWQEVFSIPDYKTMYYTLAGKVADAIELLVQAQLDGEEAFISGKNEPPIQFGELPDKKDDGFKK